MILSRLFILLNLPLFRGRERYYAARRSRGFSTDADNVAALQTPAGAAPPPSCYSRATFLSRYGHRRCLSGMQVAPNQSTHTPRGFIKRAADGGTTHHVGFS